MQLNPKVYCGIRIFSLVFSLSYCLVISIVRHQVFDILPLYSTLHPHESQKIQFTFYGHANISSQAVAQCSVHGGPNYDIQLMGQASLVQHFFDRQFVDYGKQVGHK